MKVVNDKDIKNIINKDSYEIKSTSSSILNRYNSQRKVSSYEKRSKKKLLIGGGSVLALASLSVCVIIGTIMFNQNTDQITDVENEKLFNPSQNKYLARQIGTFHSFSQTNSKTTISNVIKSRNHNEDENCEELNEEEAFEMAVNKFDPLSRGVRSIFSLNKILSNEEPCNFSYQNNTYDIRNNLFLDESLIGTYYFNSKNYQNSSHKGLYVDSDDLFYEVHINSNGNNSHKEDEEKVVTTFISLNEGDSSIVKIKKETEFEGVESEETYSYTYFSDKNSHEKNNPLYSLDYELEKEEDSISAEVSYKKKNEKSVFADIEMISEDEISFVCDEIDNCEVYDEVIFLKYLENSRVYSSNGITVTK